MVNAKDESCANSCATDRERAGGGAIAVDVCGSVVFYSRRREKKRKDIDETYAEVSVGGNGGVGRLVGARSGHPGSLVGRVGCR